jgi:riboflavin-specific deaminase-like protein
MNLNQQIESWINSRKNQFRSESRPFVTLAYAQSLDGSITTRRGEVLSLSGEKSIQLTHQLRSLHDGILIGIQTVLSDDPQLTVRNWHGSNPQPIVLDSLLRIPETAKLCHHPDKKCWVLTLSPLTGLYGDKLEILTVDSDGAKHVSLNAALALLREKGITSLMVEGGAKIITAFLSSGMVDAIVLTIAPSIVGGYKAVSTLDTGNMNHIPFINPLYSEKLGKDIIIWGDMKFDGNEN